MTTLAATLDISLRPLSGLHVEALQPPRAQHWLNSTPVCALNCVKAAVVYVASPCTMSQSRLRHTIAVCWFTWKRVTHCPIASDILRCKYERLNKNKHELMNTTFLSNHGQLKELPSLIYAHEGEKNENKHNYRRSFTTA